MTVPYLIQLGYTLLIKRTRESKVCNFQVSGPVSAKDVALTALNKSIRVHYQASILPAVSPATRDGDNRRPSSISFSSDDWLAATRVRFGVRIEDYTRIMSTTRNFHAHLARYLLDKRLMCRHVSSMVCTPRTHEYPTPSAQPIRATKPSSWRLQLFETEVYALKVRFPK